MGRTDMALRKAAQATDLSKPSSIHKTKAIIKGLACVLMPEIKLRSFEDQKLDLFGSVLVNIVNSCRM